MNLCRYIIHNKQCYNYKKLSYSGIIYLIYIFLFYYIKNRDFILSLGTIHTKIIDNNVIVQYIFLDV